MLLSQRLLSSSCLCHADVQSVLSLLAAGSNKQFVLSLLAAATPQALFTHLLCALLAELSLLAAASASHL
jgi:hypothetical protein